MENEKKLLLETNDLMFYKIKNKNKMIVVNKISSKNLDISQKEIKEMLQGLLIQIDAIYLGFNKYPLYIDKNMIVYEELY